MILRSATGERLTVLMSGSFGAWVISYDKPKAPFFISENEFNDLERIEAPAEYLEALERDKNRSEAAEKRYQIIEPLLSDVRCISDQQYRTAIVKSLSEETGISSRTISSYYYRYLATKTLLYPKHRQRIVKPEFDTAIKKYYFSAKRHSLQTTYELMLIDYYLDSEGNLKEDIPTFAAFSMYYNRLWKDSSQKTISREGLGYYKRNERLLYGSAMAYRQTIGSYQIDETPADIHIVSAFDRNATIGRPHIYLAIDIATQMITGVYVGMDDGENALLNCLANAVSNKVSFCKSLGIDIEPDEWQAEGMPFEIISDRGGEFMGDRLNEICVRYCVDININEPFRADNKGIVERAIGELQSMYSSMMAGKGLIGDDANERWAIDYRQQAVLTLDEYRQIVVICILSINNRVIDDIEHLPADAPNTPNKLWSWMMLKGWSNLMDCDANEIFVRGLPRATGTYTRKGIYFRQLRYIPVNSRKYIIGSVITFAYDIENISSIFVFEKDKSITVFHLAESSQRYEGLSYDEVKLLREKGLDSKRNDELNEVQKRIDARRKIQDIIDTASMKKERDNNEV